MLLVFAPEQSQANVLTRYGRCISDGAEEKSMRDRMKILIAYDGSACADAALADLRRAGLPSALDALVFSVAEVWMPPPPPSSYEIVEAGRDLHSAAELQDRYEKSSRAITEALGLAQSARERLRSDFPDWNVEADSSLGSPARELIAKADEWEPDLIVIGSHGRTALGRFILGSVSQKVLAEARCTVRIARRLSAPDDSPVRVVLGLDDSPDSRLAAAAVAQRRWPPKSSVTLVTAIEPFHMYGPEPGKQETRVKELHRETEAGLGEAGLNCTSVIKEGDPKHVLVEVALALNADCLFLGARGYSFLERFLIGSVSSAVAARAHCSVEVTREARD